MTHRQIEVFRAVMLCSSMTEAARILAITQSAVSKIMHEFEMAVGFSLFRRRKGGLEPTPEAFALYEEVERSYISIEKIARAADRVRSREGGRLRIAAMPALTSAFLQHVIRRFIDDGHEINASIETYNSPEIVDLVEAGHCNLGFAMTPVNTERVLVGPVMSTRCVCLLPPEHPLAQKPRISVSDLHGQPFIALAEGTTTRLRVDALFRAKNVTPRLTLEARWSLSVAAFVSEGLGCGITEPFSGRVFAAQGGIVRPLAEEIPFSFVQVHPRHKIVGGFEEEFLKCFQAEFTRFEEAAPFECGPGYAESHSSCEHITPRVKSC